MSLKMKLVSALAMMFLMVGVLIVGILGATQQTLTMTGNVQFNIADKSLYVKQVRIKQDNNSEPQIVTDFMPGYINGEFDMNIGDFTGVNSNTLGSFALYFDIINATDIQWAITNVTLSEQLQAENVKASYSGVIGVNDLTDTDSDGFKNFDPSTTEIDGTLILVISTTNSGSIDLSGITITIGEYIDAAIQVTSVSSSGVTADTYNDLAGGVAIDGSVDLSGITFNTGETTLTVSMTSLSANYIKNKVSWVNTSGVTISSTSLYLPKNPSEQLTSGTSRNLTITVNNKGPATTISGLEVEFEEKTDLLQVTEEDETSTYTKEGYWYVEMGTYSTTTDNAEGKRESEYLRWRYFSDTTSHYDFNRNTRPKGEGYFILESYFSSFASINEGGLYCSWNNDYKNSSPYKHQLNGWTNIDANDYSTSTVRQYMNIEELVSKSFTSTSTDAGTVYSPSTNSSYQSNMFIDLHIDPDNDIVYDRIIGRTLSDLYTNMGWNESSSSPTFNNVKFPDLTNADPGYQYQDTESDKFWLLSCYEAYTLLSGNATTSSDTDGEWGKSYWLRSPYSSYSNYAYRVLTSGNLTNAFVYIYTGAVRAAFKFSI